MTGNQHIVRSYELTDSVQRSPYLSEMVSCFAVEGQHFKSSEFRRQDSECLFTDILVIGTNQVHGFSALKILRALLHMHLHRIRPCGVRNGICVVVYGKMEDVVSHGKMHIKHFKKGRKIEKSGLHNQIDPG